MTVDEGTSTAMREKERRRLADDVDAFLRGGGKITKLPGIGEYRPPDSIRGRGYRKIPISQRNRGG